MNGRFLKGKAFTLIETAVILIITGVLILLSIKGKEMLYDVKIKNELTKFTKSEIALRSYYLKNERLPYKDGKIDVELLVDSNIFDSKLLTSAIYTNDKYHLLNCAYKPIDDNVSSYYNVNIIINDTLSNSITGMVCMTLTDKDNKTKEIGEQFIGLIETVIDDESYTNGNGRFIQDSFSSDYKRTVEFWEDKEFENSVKNFKYAYRVY